jgi:uncharacterized protein
MEQQILDFLKDFLSIIWEAFPFIVLGALVSGILEEYVPQQAIARLMPKNKVLAVAVGSLLGLVFPMCECGIVPIMRRLLRKGMPLGSCIAYMMAGPIINFVVIGSTIAAFAPHGLAWYMTSLRVGLGFIIGVTTGLRVEAQYRKYGDSLLNPSTRPRKDGKDDEDELAAGKKGPFLQRLGNISETALHDFKEIMVYLMLGALIAAFTNICVDRKEMERLSTAFPALTILAMMGLVIVMCLCSEADAFVAASFTTMHPAAKVAFIVLGPMFDLKLLFMFTRVFRRRLIILIAVSALVQVFVYSMIVYWVWQGLDIPYINRNTVVVPEPSLGTP